MATTGVEVEVVAEKAFLSEEGVGVEEELITLVGLVIDSRRKDIGPVSAHRATRKTP